MLVFSKIFQRRQSYLVLEDCYVSGTVTGANYYKWQFGDGKEGLEIR
jgi:hypothetical protein